MHQSTLSFDSMSLYEKITQKIELVAKVLAVFTLFVLPISTSLTVILFMLTSLLVLLSGRWREKWTLIKNNPVALSFLTLFLVYVVAMTYSIGTHTEVKHELLKFGWLLLTPLWIPLFIEEKWQQRGVNSFLISMLITLILSYFKYFHWISSTHFWYILSHRQGASGSSVFKDYIIQSFLMSLAAVIFLFRALLKRSWVYVALFLLATGNILFVSQARTGYIIFFILLAYTLLSQLTLKKALFYGSISIAALITLLAVLPGSIHYRAHHALQDIRQWKHGNEKTSLGYRIAWQDNAIKLLKKKPIIGYGTGSIRAAFATLPKIDTQQTGIVGNASNEYLNVALQFGLIGLVVFLGMLLLQWRYSFRLPKEHGLIIQSLLIAMCIGNLANSWLTDFTQSHYYALMMMLTFATLSKRRALSPATDRAYNDDAARGTPS